MLFKALESVVYSKSRRDIKLSLKLPTVVVMHDALSCGCNEGTGGKDRLSLEVRQGYTTMARNHDSFWNSWKSTLTANQSYRYQRSQEEGDDAHQEERLRPGSR